MDNQLPELKVNMLGRFSITYGEQPITFKCIRPLSAAIRAAFSGQTGPY